MTPGEAVVQRTPAEEAESVAYQHWRDESKRAEREFRTATKVPKADLDAALEEADRKHKERVAGAKRAVSVAAQIHRRAVEVARIDHRKAIDLAEVNLKEAMAKARTPVRDAEEAFKTTADVSRRSLEGDGRKARELFESRTAEAYAARRRIKSESWADYLRANEAAQPAQESK